MALNYGTHANAGIAAADTDEILYTVPATTRVVGQIVVKNTSTASNRTFRLAIVPSGDVLGPEHYYHYDIGMIPGAMIALTAVTLNDGDKIYIRSDAISDTVAGTGMVFSLMGEKETI